MNKPYHSKARNGQIASISKIAQRLVTPLCKQQGFISASIVLDWEAIVGAHFANLCEAIKVSFSAQQQGCLHVRASSAAALAVIYEKELILERINRFYGYKAIKEIRVIHGPLTRQQNVAKKRVSAPVAVCLEDMEASPLKEALEALGGYLLQQNS